MFEWIKKYHTEIIAALVCAGFTVYCYSCQSTTRSLVDDTKRINRQELQLELDQFITMGRLRMLDLDKQDQLRGIILQNALVLVQGQPLNPLGIITAVAAVYGVLSGGSNVVKKVKEKRNKGKPNNGSG